MTKCKQCGVELQVVPGKVQKQFCSDTHRKAYKRAELRESEVTAAPPVDEPRTINSKVTPDTNLGQPKRGKDIKCFADLPPDVQNSINNYSMGPDGIDQTEKAKRTAAAIKYQHLFPHSYEPIGNCPTCVGVVTGKPGDADYNGVCTPEWRAERGR